ncbi:hypothetical protein K439DRAFT_1270164, partial [Ramaria rubella]
QTSRPTCKRRPYDKNTDYLQNVQEHSDNQTYLCGHTEDSQFQDELLTDIPEAITGRNADKWKPSIECELKGFIDNDVYDIVPTPDRVKPIPSHSTFKVKQDQNGNI